MGEKELAVCGVCGTVSSLEVQESSAYGVVNVVEIKCPHVRNVEDAFGFEPDELEGF